MNVHVNEACLGQDWASYTLIVPVVSIGNAGQLAADLIISTLKLVKGGSLHHEALLPVVGPAAFSHTTGLTFGLEIFYDSDRKLACLQQRSPASPGLQAEFARALADWIKTASFRQVWILGSLDAIFRADKQLTGSQLRFWAKQPALSSLCVSKGLTQLEDDWFTRSGEKSLEQRLLPPWPLLLALDAGSVPTAALLTFSLEGDNLPDAYCLADTAANVLDLHDWQLAGSIKEGSAVGNGGHSKLAWLPPSSWKYALGQQERPLLY